MNITQLSKTTKPSKKRLGQGHGSGRGKTSGRGTKGQKARRNISLTFEGGAISLIKRLPFRRGKGRNASLRRKPIALNISVLSLLPKESKVDIETLIKLKIVDAEDAHNVGVKILGNGEITVPLHVAVPVSKQAKTKIEKAGGTVNQAS